MYWPMPKRLFTWVWGITIAIMAPAHCRQAYAELCEIYKLRGKTQEEIDRLVVLDVRGQQFFTEYGFTDQHAGGGAFAHDETTMGWLFGLHEKGTSQ